MITKWKIIDPQVDYTTTYRFWCNDEIIDLGIADYLVNKYVGGFGYTTKGLVKIKVESDDLCYQINTTLPFSVFKKNNDFFEFVAVSDKQVKGIKNK